MRPYRLIAFGVVLTCIAANAFSSDTSAHLYKSKCQGCHGAAGKATPMGKKIGARDFQDPDVASMSEDELATVTKNGKNKMPAYKGKLTDQQIDGLVKYIKAMK